MKLNWNVNGMTGTAEWDGAVHIHGPFEGTVREAKAVLKIDPPDGLFFNGYQSWTDSREHSVNGRMHDVSSLPAALLDRYASGEKLSMQLAPQLTQAWRNSL